MSRQVTSMDDRIFASYLEDHLVGSGAGLTVARRLRRGHPGGELGAAMLRLEVQIEDEQRALRTAIERLGGAASGPGLVGRVMGLAAGVVTTARRVVLPEPVPSLLEDLESLAVGVWGKRLLWGALARRAMEDPRLADIEIERLVEQAEAQELEILRLRDDVLQPVSP
jgi:hypothetical protein